MKELYNREYFTIDLEPRPFRFETRESFPSFNTYEEAREWVTENFPEYTELSTNDYRQCIEQHCAFCRSKGKWYRMENKIFTINKEYTPSAYVRGW